MVGRRRNASHQTSPSGSAGRTIVQSDESNPFGKPADVASGNAEGVVRGCVVDDDDFPVFQSLCENALQTFGEKASAVVIRQNDRYDWRSHDGASVSGISHAHTVTGCIGRNLPTIPTLLHPISSFNSKAFGCRQWTSIGPLTRISHQWSAAAPHTSAITALRLVGRGI